MNRAVLTRLETGDQGTFGELVLAGFHCFTAELPWRDNQKSISCIPAGEYVCAQRHSKKFEHHFHVLEVPGRDWILIHTGNFSGDRALGFRSHTYGCILVGRRLGRLQAFKDRPMQSAVLASRFAMTDLLNSAGGEPFRLLIKGAV